MLCGGFPCQDISVAGKGKGIKEGTRSGLWFEYARAIRELRPQLALIENVPMLARRGLNIVLADLAEMGYDAEWFTLSAQEVGAWHKRERLFILAYPISDVHLNKVTRLNGTSQNLEGVNRQEDSSARKPRGAGNVRTSDQGYVSNPDCEWQQQPSKTIEDIRGWSGNSREKHLPDPISTGTRMGEPGDSRQDGEVANTSQPEVLRQEHGANSPERIEASSTVVSDSQSRGASAKEQPGQRHVSECIGETRAIYFRKNQEGIWATEPSVGRVAHGIPSRVDRIKCLGNAVVPQVAEVIGEIILEAM